MIKCDEHRQFQPRLGHKPLHRTLPMTMSTEHRDRRRSQFLHQGQQIARELSLHCGLMIGYRRQRFHCQFCPQATCQFCVEIGANGTFWCGGCLPSTQTLQLAQSAAFIKPPARIGRNGKVTGTPSPSLDRENQASPVASPLTFFGTNPATPLDPDLVPKCLLCSQKFNVFNWRKVCDGCKLVICDKCCKKVRGVLGAGSRADSQKEGLLCVKCVTPR